MKKIFLCLFIYSSLLTFSQEIKSDDIKVSPKNFKNTILLKISPKLNFPLDVFILNDSNDVLKTINIGNDSKKTFKLDLSNLKFNNNFKVKVVNSEYKVLFSQNIYKSIK
jgi:hypothetical protein